MAIITAITEVFDSMSTWLQTAIKSALSLFWDSTASNLTILGVLAVCALAVSIFFLLLGLVQNFFHFRG